MLAVSCTEGAAPTSDASLSPEAHFDAHERATLTGLAGVYVVLDGITSDLERLGLHPSELLQGVEAQLRTGRILVLARDEARMTAGTPYLYVNVNAVPSAMHAFAYTVRIELNQGVFLERVPTLRTIAATWQTAAVIGSVERNGFANAVAEDIRAQVARFVDAYRASKRGP